VTQYPHAHFLLSVAAPGQFPPDEGVEIAFAGRSNCGKSSAINAITRRHGFARTSKTPGRTQLLNYFELAPQARLVDLPGYGFAHVRASERSRWPPLIDRLAARKSLRGLFLVVDVRRGVGEADEQLIAWANPLQRVIHVLLSKADKLTRNEGAQALAAARTALAGTASVQLFSVPDKTGVAEAQERLYRWLKTIKNPGDSVTGITGAD
jgi:GTP-binding protein